MSVYLGIDTSNYTTSVCLYDSESKKVVSKRRLLPVKEGEKGLRQSDAVFHHVQQLPELFEETFAEYDGSIRAIGVSYAPRTVTGSYMPCFTVGLSQAQALGSVLHIPVYRFSHQQGHIAAALYSIDRLDYLQQPLIAFHVSGGTTEALLVNRDDGFLPVKTIARTLDLNAGQLIDRIGVKLGLRFPCGRELEAFALECDDKICVKATLKGADCCLSGGENLADKLLREGKSRAYVARFAIEYVLAAVEGMSEELRKIYPELPFIYAGGVMSDAIIRDRLTARYDCLFAKPEYSSDNAAGISVLTAMMDQQ